MYIGIYTAIKVYKGCIKPKGYNMMILRRTDPEVDVTVRPLVLLRPHPPRRPVVVPLLWAQVVHVALPPPDPLAVPVW